MARIARSVGLDPATLEAGVYGPGRSLWRRTRVGAIREEDHWAEVARSLRLSEDWVERIRAALFEDVVVRQGLVRFLAGCKGRCRLALVRNAIPSFSATWARLGWEALFDVLINSSAVGVAKPDAWIFEVAAARLGVAPVETVLLDDQAANVEAARHLGFAAIQVSGQRQAIAALRACLG